MNVKYLLLSVLALALASCGGANKKNKVETTQAKEVATQTKHDLTVDTSTSVINWIGYKIGGNHSGTIKLKSGKLSVDGDKILSGSFIIDMNSIKNTDMDEGKMRDQLVAHLKSEDFFDVSKYPTAVFEITSAQHLDDENYQVEGNLKMKDVSKNITFEAQIKKNTKGVYTAISNVFVINRTEWNVNYGSKNIFKDLKDAVIQDDVEIKLVISAYE